MGGLGGPSRQAQTTGLGHVNQGWTNANTGIAQGSGAAICPGRPHGSVDTSSIGEGGATPLLPTDPLALMASQAIQFHSIQRSNIARVEVENHDYMKNTDFHMQLASLFEIATQVFEALGGCQHRARDRARRHSFSLEHARRLLLLSQSLTRSSRWVSSTKKRG